MKDNGKMINSMERASKNGKIMHNIKVNIFKEKKTD